MVASPVKIGPFNGGLNSYSGPTSIGDNECNYIRNFDIDLDGSLYSRSPITTITSTGLTGSNGNIEGLGWFLDTNGSRYFIFTVAGVGTYARNEDTNAVTTITTTIVASVCVQYANKLWLVANPASANPGGSWTPAGGFVAVAAIPKGTSLCIYKERLFIGGSTTQPNRIYFSNAADFTTWVPGTNFFDARAGDGQDVITIITYQDTVVIFKAESTYAFSYDSNPSRGSVRVINGSVGASNRQCVVEYEGSLYVNDEDKVYQVSQWNFTLINLKVPFIYTVTYGGVGTNQPTLSILSDRLICHYFDNIYVFNLRMGVWTQWDVDATRLFTQFIEVPRRTAADPEKYYAGCRTTVAGTSRQIFEWRPTPDALRSENISCTVTTKAYDFNVPYTFKRLFWWGADILSRKDLTYLVQPVTYSSSVTHQQLSAYRHNQIVGTHLRPLDVVIDVGGSISISNATGYRMFVKFIKSLRFRQISFTIGGTTDGTTLTGPIRLYGISAFVDNKQLVSKTIS